MKKNYKKFKEVFTFSTFFENEKASGVILIGCTLFSLGMANSFFSQNYLATWHIPIFGQNIEYWINDGLMTIFFLVVGLELKREINHGELSTLKNALLPIFAAFGGMLVPALLYLFFNFGTATQSGFGIPMATDIAFALGVLSLLGNRVPLSLKVFLTALAVIDDLGAIVVIALFYSKTISFANLAGALAVLALLYYLKINRFTKLFPYLIGGVIMWFFMLHSGIHATITGVLLAMVLPDSEKESKSASTYLENVLHRPVAFVILPLFALANTAIIISPNIGETIQEKYSIGLALGLVLGKPIGIFLFSYLAVFLGFCKLPLDIRWKTIASVGFLGGIGFTMSIFVTLLAFKEESIVTNVKFIILLSSLIAGFIGFIALKINLKQKENLSKN